MAHLILTAPIGMLLTVCFLVIGLIATISHCKDRGFWGRVNTQHGAFDIERVDGITHRVTTVDVERERRELRQSMSGDAEHDIMRKYEESEHDIASSMDSDFSNDEAGKRRLEEIQVFNNGNCAKIQILLITTPYAYTEYFEKYGDFWEKRLEQDTLAMMLEVQGMFKNTRWQTYRVTFICFDIMILGIHHSQIWEEDIWNGLNSTHGHPPQTHLEMLEVLRFDVVKHHCAKKSGGSDHCDREKWPYSFVHALSAKRDVIGTHEQTYKGMAHLEPCVDPSGGVALASYFFNPTVIAHELGHNLGIIEHDGDEGCAKYGGATGNIMVSGTIRTDFTFSRCSVLQIYDRSVAGFLDCLEDESTASVPDFPQTENFDGFCGNGIVEAWEECDGGAGCTDDCKWVRGYCPPGWKFQCLKVENQGEPVRNMDTGYIGYFGGCRRGNRHTYYKEANVLHGTRSRLYLKRSKVIQNADDWTLFDDKWFSTTLFPNGVSNGWWFVSTSFKTSQESECPEKTTCDYLVSDAFCPADPVHADSVPDNCDWRWFDHYSTTPRDGQDGPFLPRKLPNLSLMKVKRKDNTRCTETLDTTRCIDLLQNNNLPRRITIYGSMPFSRLQLGTGVFLHSDSASWKVDVNGEYKLNTLV